MKKFKIVIIILTLVILTSCILIKLITLKTSYSDGEKVSADGRTENNQLLLLIMAVQQKRGAVHWRCRNEQKGRSSWKSRRPIIFAFSANKKG